MHDPKTTPTDIEAPAKSMARVENARSSSYRAGNKQRGGGLFPKENTKRELILEEHSLSSFRGRARWLFLAVQSFNALLLFSFFGSADIWVLATSGALCIPAYLYLIRYELTEHPFVATPFVCFLISGLLRLGIVPFWGLVCELAGEEDAFLFTRYDMREWIIEGQFLLVFGDLLFVLGYTLLQRYADRYSQSRASMNTQPAAAAYAALLIALPFIALTVVAPGALRSLGQIGDYFSGYGVTAAILLMLISRRLSKKIPWWVIGITLAIGLAESLRSYMKQDTIKLFLPFALCALPLFFYRLRRGLTLTQWLQVGICGLAAIIGLSWLFAFSQIRRADFWQSQGRIQFRLDESDVAVWPAAKAAAISLVPGSPEFEEHHQLPDQGLWSIFSRHADFVAASWAYKDLVEVGNNEGEFIRTGLISLIPRIFWPEKPEIAQGRNVAVRLGQATSFEDATTSTHVGGMAAALFLDLGWAWLILGMILSGMLFGLTSNAFFPRLMDNPFAAIACIALYFQSIRHFESGFAAGIDTYAYPLVVLLPLAIVWQRFLISSLR